MNHYQLIVIGGGPAGLAAALSAWENGLRKVLILERDTELGGILNQCIHNGFGLHTFGEELTGPEYAGRFIDRVKETGIEVKLDTMVLDFTTDKTVHAVSPAEGYQIYTADSIVLAMGCRERNRGPIRLAGERGSGVFSAGSAQRYLNMEGYLVGKKVVILGSGDIGLIMARRMTLEGAKVLAVLEIMPHSSGLNRNIVQCLQDYDIPLYLSHTVVDVVGDKRVEKVVAAKVDDRMKPIPGTEMTFECDTLLLSVGLVPENELSRGAGVPLDGRTNGAIVYENMQTQCPGIFAGGNVLHVHDLVDFVSAECTVAGKEAAAYVLAGCPAPVEEPYIEVITSPQLGYTVPQRIRPGRVEKSVQIFFRVRKKYGASRIVVKSGEETIASFKREHMAPGEMEKITIPAVLLAKCNDKLEISIEEGIA